MYGNSTRDVVVWVPSKLLRKGFGVTDPNPPADDPPPPALSASTADPLNSAEALMEVLTASFAPESSKNCGKRDLRRRSGGRKKR